MGDLERLLDPSYTEHLTLSNDAKLELVLAGIRFDISSFLMKNQLKLIK